MDMHYPFLHATSFHFKHADGEVSTLIFDSPPHQGVVRNKIHVERFTEGLLESRKVRSYTVDLKKGSDN